MSNVARRVCLLASKNLASRPLASKPLASQLRFGSVPKGRLGKGTDDRIVSAVVPSKTFVFNFFNGERMLDSIYNRVFSVVVTLGFGAAVIIYWKTQVVFSVYTLFLAIAGTLWMQTHLARPWVWILLALWMTYKFLELDETM